MRAFNERLAALITRSVGTMACAYLFACIALVSLPSVISTGDPVAIVSWVAQTFLQLVLLSIILVGQSLQADGIHNKLDAHHHALKAHIDRAVRD